MRFTCNSDGSWVGLPGVAMFQTGDSGKVSHMGSNPPFRPPGNTTWSPYCKSLHTSSWLRCPQVLMLGACHQSSHSCAPSLDMGVCNISSLRSCKGIHPISAYVNQQCKLMCCLTQGVVAGLGAGVHQHCYQAEHPLSFDGLVLCTIRRNAMLGLGFSMSPHAPAVGEGMYL